MWFELTTPAKTRILVNLDATFCFEEQADKSVNAVSITGIGVPIAGMSYDAVTAQVIEALEKS